MSTTTTVGNTTVAPEPQENTKEHGGSNPATSRASVASGEHHYNSGSTSVTSEPRDQLVTYQEHSGSTIIPLGSITTNAREPSKTPPRSPESTNTTLGSTREHYLDSKEHHCNPQGAR